MFNDPNDEREDDEHDNGLGLDDLGFGEGDAGLPQFDFEPVTQGDTSGNARSCDHDSEDKVVITESESRGVSLGGFGGNYGGSTAKIVCKECETIYEVEPESKDEFGRI